MPRKIIKTLSIVIASAVVGVFLFLLATGSIVYFGDNRTEPEASTKFYDKIYEKVFIDALEKENIPYRRESDGSIWYSVKYQEQIKEIWSYASSKYPVKFEIFDKNILDNFLRLLTEAKVEYEIFNTDKGKAIIVESQYQTEAAEAFRKAR